MRAACLALGMLIAACGDDGSSTPRVDAPPEDAPPDAITMALSNTLYLAFDGGAVAPGNDDAIAGTSTLATQSATLAPYLMNDPQRATKLAAIVTQLTTILQPYNITITMARPAAGTYHMVLFTSAAPSAIGASGTGSALVPATCNNMPAVIGFGFGNGNELPRDIAVRNTIAMFGLMSGIPLSAQANDCMCLTGAICANLPAPCSIGAGGIAVVTGPGSCGVTGTMNESELFRGRFGPR